MSKKGKEGSYPFQDVNVLAGGGMASCSPYRWGQVGNPAFRAGPQEATSRSESDGKPVFRGGSGCKRRSIDLILRTTSGIERKTAMHMLRERDGHTGR